MTPRSLSLIAILALGIADSAGARERWLFKQRPAPAMVCQPAPVPLIAVPPAPAVKTYTVAFDKAKWADVFAWLAKETKLVCLSTEVPTGTLTLKSDEKYTLPELFDLLDEVLEQKNYTLLRREHSFLIHPADEKIPREILHQITLEELKLRGKREIVQVVIPLKNLIAEDVAPQAKKLLSRFGEVTAFGTNQLIVVDRVRNIRNILGFVREQEPMPDQRREELQRIWKTYDVPANAEAIAKRIMDSLKFKGSNVKTLVIGDSKVMVCGTPADHADVAEFLNPPPAVIVVPNPVSVAVGEAIGIPSARRLLGVRDCRNMLLRAECCRKEPRACKQRFSIGGMVICRRE